MGSVNHKLQKFGTKNPGPGTYQPMAANETSLHYSMGEKLNHKENAVKRSMQMPGPGAYDAVPSFKYDGHTKFGSSTRTGIYNDKQAKFVPSPFQYNQKADSIQRSAAKFSFGKERQRPHTSKSVVSVPGPGTYTIRQMVGNDCEGKTLSQKLCPSFEKPGANRVPGPGTYGDEYAVTKK